MVQINNQAVIQKLIDELKLYPGTGMIPTELADKILPVFQINTQEITMTQEPSNIVRSANSDGGIGLVTIYSVPATGKFYLTNVALSSSMFGGAADQTLRVIVKCTIDGTAQEILTAVTRHNLDDTESSNLSLNLQNPILIDQSTNITIQQSTTDAYATASVVGYTAD